MSGSKASIAIIVLAIVGGLAFMANKKSKKQDSKLEPLHSKGTSA